MKRHQQAGPTWPDAGVGGHWVGVGPNARPPDVSLEQFARLTRQLALGAVDLPSALADEHVTDEQWQDSSGTWKERIRTDIDVAREFNHLFTNG